MKNIFDALTGEKKTTVTREQLSEAIAPFAPRKLGQKNADIAAGWDETAEWLRIAFDGEKPKGHLYHALYASLTKIASAVRSAPEGAETFEIETKYLSLLKTSQIQFSEAKRSLLRNAEIKKSGQRQIVTDRQGNKLVVPFTQIYNRPNADHYKMGLQMKVVEDRMGKFFAKLPSVKEASDLDVAEYADKGNGRWTVHDSMMVIYTRP